MFQFAEGEEGVARGRREDLDLGSGLGPKEADGRVEFLGKGPISAPGPQPFDEGGVERNPDEQPSLTPAPGVRIF